MKYSSVATKALLRFIARVVTRIGFFPVLLSIVDRWGLKKKTAYRLAFPFVERRQHRHFQILYYHRVNDAQDPFFDAVPVKVFARQMEVLHEFFNVLPLEELVEAAAKNDVPPNSVAITFDDGYSDNYENAFPILKQFSLPATIFLATGPLDSNNLLWHDKVFESFRQTDAQSITLKGNQYPLMTLSQKRVALHAVLKDLRMHNTRDRNDLIQELTNKLGMTDQCCSGVMKLSWSDVEEMAKHQITFGAHTVTHPILTQIDLAEVENEIMICKNAIENRLMSPVRLFAYPNGNYNDFNETTKVILKESGFLCAVTTLWGTNSICTDPFELRRVGIWEFDAIIFAMKLGWY